MSIFSRILVLLAALFRVSLAAASASDLPIVPIFRIETGMHTNWIRNIAVDSTGKILASASDDKTVRVWNLATGAIEQTLRPPIDLENEGKIYAVAFSPDDKQIVCGGWTNDEKGPCVYVFDRNGQLTRRLGNIHGSVTRLGFSPDGKNLAVLTSRGLAVWEFSTGKIVAEDRDYGSISFSLDFNRAGMLVTACQDGYVRLYDSHFRLVKKHLTGENSSPCGLKFSPDGQQIGVGFDDVEAVQILSSTSLELLFSPKDDGPVQHAYVTWSPDSHYLYASSVTAPPSIRRWDEAGRGEYKDFCPGWEEDHNPERFALHGVLGTMGILALQDGRLAWCSSDPMWGVLETNGKDSLVHSRPTASFTRRSVPFQLSNNGEAVRFGYNQYDSVGAQFDTNARELIPFKAPEEKFDKNDFNQNTQRLKPDDDENNEEDPNWHLRLTVPSIESPFGVEFGLVGPTFESLSVKGTQLAMEDNEKNSSVEVAIAPDYSGFVVGSFMQLHFYDNSGKELWKTDIPSRTMETNISTDGRLVVAAFEDGTVRWYSRVTGKELLTLFAHPDKKRWAMWTTSGYYDCSPGMENLIGWHVNNGHDKEASFYPASRFRSTYYRPDVLTRVLKTLDENEAVRLANLTANVTTPDDRSTNTKGAKQAESTKKPPVMRLISPAGDTLKIDARRLTLRYAIKTPSGAEVNSVQVLIDGRPVKIDSDLSLSPYTANGEIEGQITVDLPEKKCVLSIFATDRFTFSEPVVLTIIRPVA